MVIQSPPNRPGPPPDKNQMMIRAATLGVIAVVLFGVLVFRLWALQVLHSDHYVAQANQNDVRQLPLPAPRGEIVDSTGKVLVKNTSHVLAEVNPAGLATRVDCTTFPADQRAKCNAAVAATPPGAVPRCAALKGQTRCLVLARLGVRRIDQRILVLPGCGNEAVTVLSKVNRLTEEHRRELRTKVFREASLAVLANNATALRISDAEIAQLAVRVRASSELTARSGRTGPTNIRREVARRGPT